MCSGFDKLMHEGRDAKAANTNGIGQWLKSVGVREIKRIGVDLPVRALLLLHSKQLCAAPLPISRLNMRHLVSCKRQVPQSNHPCRHGNARFRDAITDF
jgi:hypothetical protein